MLDITLKETRVYREIKEEAQSRLLTLCLPKLEDLSEALLDFTSLADLEQWLADMGKNRG